MPHQSYLSEPQPDINIQPSLEELDLHRRDATVAINQLGLRKRRVSEVSDRVEYVVKWANLLDYDRYNANGGDYLKVKQYVEKFKKEALPPVMSVKAVPLKTQYTGLTLRGEWLANKLYTARAVGKLLGIGGDKDSEYRTLIDQILIVVNQGSRKLQKAYGQTEVTGDFGFGWFKNVPNELMNQIADLMVIGSEPDTMSIKTNESMKIATDLEFVHGRFLASLGQLYIGAPKVSNQSDFFAQIFYPYVLQRDFNEDKRGFELSKWLLANFNSQDRYDLMVNQFTSKGLPVNHSLHPCEVFTCYPDIRHLLPTSEQLKPRVNSLIATVAATNLPVEPQAAIEEERQHESLMALDEWLEIICNEPPIVTPTSTSSPELEQYTSASFTVIDDAPGFTPATLEIKYDESFIVSPVEAVRALEPVVVVEPAQVAIEKPEPVIEPPAERELVTVGIAGSEATAETITALVQDEKVIYYVDCNDATREGAALIAARRKELLAQGVKDPHIVARDWEVHPPDQKVFFNKPGYVPYILDLVEGTLTILDGYRIMPVNIDMPSPVKYAEMCADSVYEEIERLDIDWEKEKAQPGFDPNPQPPALDLPNWFTDDEDDSLAMEDDDDEDEDEC